MNLLSALFSAGGTFLCPRVAPSAIAKTPTATNAENAPNIKRRFRVPNKPRAPCPLETKI